jgi:hypothetical protein
MKVYLLLATGALALAACNQTPATPPQPESAGAAGEAYCEGPPPTDPTGMEQWNRLCQAGGGRR